MKNPFNPSFGVRPEQFLGRDDVVDSFINAISNKNDPWRSTLLIGVRGSGKTATLTQIQTKAMDKDTFVVSVSPEADFLDNILGQLHKQMSKSKLKGLPRLKSISLSYGISISLEQSDNMPAFTKTFRYQITEMLDIVKKSGKDVIFLIDESQKHSEDLRTFIGTYQHLIREEYPICLIMAGLPEVVSEILNDSVLTFFRRANQVLLRNVGISLVRQVYKNVFINTSRNLSEPLLEDAAECTYGYPYLIQLIGYYLWENIKNGYCGDLIAQVLVEAKDRLFRNVHQLVYDKLSPKDKEFLFAMVDDYGMSLNKDIITRLGKGKSYVSMYRARLISRGIVASKGYGTLEYSYPYMREFLIEKRKEIDL
jgi:hypothetical protein